MALGAALVDRGRVIRREPAGRKVKGRTIYASVPGEWFRCRLTIGGAPQSIDQATGARVQTSTPTLLYGTLDVAGGLVEVTGEDRIEVESPELGTKTWDVTGDPEPLRKKRRVIGYQATLRRVEVHAGEAA